MQSEINIFTFYWQGEDRPGWGNVGIGSEYVNRLYRGIKRNLTLSFNFCCLTNVPAIIPNLEREIQASLLLPKSWKGCLPKLEAHNPNYQSGLNGRILVFDLDTVITGDLTDICSFNGASFITRAWFKGIRMGQWLSGGDLLSFDVGSTNYLYEKYKKDPKDVEKWTGGRERFVYREWANPIDYWQRIFPGQIVSYKNHMIDTNEIPKNARIVSCHGNPRPHEMVELSWIKENWK